MNSDEYPTEGAKELATLAQRVGKKAKELAKEQGQRVSLTKTFRTLRGRVDIKATSDGTDLNFRVVRSQKKSPVIPRR